MHIAGMSRRLGWGIIGALAVALLAALAGVIYAGPPDPPGNLSAGSPTQEQLIFQPANCAGFPITISASGSYKLAGNITMPASCTQDGIDISASDVLLDLNGFIVNGSGVGLNGISVTCSCTTETIRAGVVLSWTGAGISLATAQVSLLDSVQSNGNAGPGITLGTNNKVQDSAALTNSVNIIAQSGDTIANCVAGGNSGNSIAIVGTNNVVTGTLSALAGTGISLSPGADGNDIEGNKVLTNSIGIEVYGSGNVIKGNHLSAHFGNNLFVDAGVRSNVIDGNDAESGGTGFSIGAPGARPNILVRNTAAGNSTNYSIGAGNDAAPQTTAAAMTNPAGNISD